MAAREETTLDRIASVLEDYDDDHISATFAITLICEVIHAQHGASPTQVAQRYVPVTDEVRRAAREIVADFGPEKWVQCIKELRSRFLGLTLRDGKKAIEAAVAQRREEHVARLMAADRPDPEGRAGR